MRALSPSAKSFVGGPNASKPVSSFTTKNMRRTKHPPTKDVTLSYSHVDYLMLGMVRFREVRHEIGYNINVLQQTACLVVNPITVGNFAFLFNCKPVGRTSDSMMVPT